MKGSHSEMFHYGNVEQLMLNFASILLLVVIRDLISDDREYVLIELKLIDFGNVVVRTVKNRAKLMKESAVQQYMGRHVYSLLKYCMSRKDG